MKKIKKRYVALYGCPVDNSIRAYVFTTKKGIKKHSEKYKDIFYFIMAIKTNDYLINI